VPERGWWAKKAAGHNVEKPPLLPAKTPGIETIQLYVRDDFRQWLTTEERDFFEKRLLDESSAPPVIPEVDDIRHPLIVQSRKKRQNADGPVPLHMHIAVSEPLRDRALRLATGLVNACEVRGYTFERQPDATDGVAFVQVFGHPIGIWIVEPPQRVPHCSRHPKRGRKQLAAAGRYPNTTRLRAGSSRSFWTILLTVNAAVSQAARNERSKLCCRLS
jgi:hypothetical protein